MNENKKFNAAMFVAFDFSKAEECIEEERKHQQILMEGVGQTHPAGMTAQTVLNNLQKLQTEEEKNFYFLKHALRNSAGEYLIIPAYGIMPVRENGQIIGVELKYGYRLEFVRAFEPGFELKSVKFTFKHLRDVFRMYDTNIEVPELEYGTLTEEKDNQAFAKVPSAEMRLDPGLSLKEHAERLFSCVENDFRRNKMPVFGYVSETESCGKKQIVFRAFCHSTLIRDCEKWQQRAVALMQMQNLDHSPEIRWQLGSCGVLRYLNSEFQPKTQRPVVLGAREPARAKLTHGETNVCAICGKPLFHALESCGEELCAECSGKQEHIRRENEVSAQSHCGLDAQKEHGTFC